MALIVEDRVADTTTTTGTSALVVSGTAPDTYRTPSAVMAVNDTAYCLTVHQSLPEWELGLYTYSATNTLTRTSVIKGSNGTSPVNFSAGSKYVFITNRASLAATLMGGLTPAADKLPYFSSSTAAALADLTSFGRSIIAAASAAATKTLLAIASGDVSGLGSLATKSTVATADIDNVAVTAGKLATGAAASNLGFTPLNPANNLSEVAVAATARTNLGLAALATKATVATADIDNVAVTTAKIADSNVTTAKIADANVTTAKIADANVTTAKIADANVTAAKLASGAAVSNLGYTPWHAGNDGSGSGLDADTVDGLNPSATAGTASRIVVADASGYINNTYFNSSDDTTSGTVTYLMAKFGDNYLRSASAAKVNAFLGNGWALVQSQTVSSSVTGVTFSSSVSSYKELLLISDTVPSGGTGGVIRVEVSVNSGSSKITCQYERAQASGAAEASNPYIDSVGNTGGTGDRQFAFHCFNFGFDNMFARMCDSTTSGFRGQAQGVFQTGANTINWLRVFHSGGNIRGDLASTTFRLYGRN